MQKWTVNTIKKFYNQLNERFGLQVDPKIVEGEKDKFPLCRRDGMLLFIPDFLNHEELKEDVKRMLLVELYCCFHLDKNNGHLDVNPGFMAKGLCDEMGFTYVSDNEIECNLRTIRRKLYNDVTHGCYFRIGHKLRENKFTSYQVTNICRKSTAETVITVRRIGSNLGEPDQTFSEEELFDHCCNFQSFENVKVDMRTNIYILSGPSGVGKDTVFRHIKEKYPEINKTVSVTTRCARNGEINGVDYYFVTKDEFYRYQKNDMLVEYELYDTEYYGTLVSEIEKHPNDKPIVLIVDVRGRCNVLRKYPLAKSVFIEPSSLNELKIRLLSRGENTSDEIEHRLEIAKEELEEKKYFDYVVTNENVEKCANEILDII